MAAAPCPDIVRADLAAGAIGDELIRALRVEDRDWLENLVAVLGAVVALLSMAVVNWEGFADS
ncbi:hypothetical protein [Rhizobium ruizarguesonis]|uniref:hypothetical protein n=1 Tax=Rhizobium ruizarguesonis TaxID=2081791 RepID=UPI00103101CB|nr:hypothetical protein [Rhizobium ruizarguesonis]TBE67465.1 hypothetical protein ELH00_16505 [Rhizobium ruizarguesonis]